MVDEGQGLLRSAAPVQGESGKGHMIDYRCRQSDSDVCIAIREVRKLRAAMRSGTQPANFDTLTTVYGDGEASTSNLSERKSIAKDRSGVARESVAPILSRVRSAQATGDLLYVSEGERL